MNYKPSNFENAINNGRSLVEFQQECRECEEIFLEPEYLYCSKCRNSLLKK